MPVSNQARLRAFNGALRLMGERKLSGLAEVGEAATVLTDAWGSDDVPKLCLGMAEWNFALRTVQAAYSPSVEPDFGFMRAYDKPSDFVRLSRLGGDERFYLPYSDRQYSDEAGYWFSDADILFVRYVSSDDDYGLDDSLWSEEFVRVVEAQLAVDVAWRLTHNDKILSYCEAKLKQRRSQAAAKDALDEGAKFFPPGTWARVRTGGW